ncbi:MAG TPA: EamA family transporter, partial [Anaerolineaceae bacterium]|nr:EamA family transporter [Anaerolineaceae bacterium]
MGVLFALLSALVWGSGDFCGGLAARRHNQFQVLVFASLSGLAVMILFAALAGETFPAFPNLLWAIIAGVSGAMGLAALYRG